MKSQPLHIHFVRLLCSAFVLVLSGMFVLSAGEPTSAQSGVCSSGRNSTYTVTVCITNIIPGTTLSGVQPVDATFSVEGPNPGLRDLRFYLRGNTEITDGRSPYTFNLPTHHFVDGNYTLAVAAMMKDNFITPRANISVKFKNNNTTPPVNLNTFTPRRSAAGTVAAVGDGAGYFPENGRVSDLVVSKQPGMFLYLGDVYNRGTHSEFYNWYGEKGVTGYARLAAITNPTLGNHETGSSGAAPYFFYWDNVPHYYSYDSYGWHFISLDSTTTYNQYAPGTPQYEWLAQDLDTNELPCVIVYFHHPRYSVGPQKDNPAIAHIWSLMAQAGVDVMLTGHEHSYQRWQPLDVDGNLNAQGMTQFVVGTGGHSNQSLARVDTRVDYKSSRHYGALFMDFAPTYVDYRFINDSNQQRDSGRVYCNGTIQPPIQTYTLTPVADAYVVVNKTTNYGAATKVMVDASPETWSYLRFEVPPLSGTIIEAKLHLYTTNGSSWGYEVYGVGDNTWLERNPGGIHWATRPALGPHGGSSGNTTTNTWTRATITSLVGGAGPVNLALKGTSTTAINFSSREGVNPPMLVISTSPSGQPAVASEPADWLTIDSDGDGLLDADEFENGTDINVTDSDGDALPDLWEVEAGLNATVATDSDGSLGDPDGDGYTNIDEYNQLSDPMVSDGPALEDEDTLPLGYDSEGDGLSDEDELENGTDPNAADTDGDGLPDLWEVETGLDARLGTGADGAVGDPDRDGTSNLDEYNQQTDPLESPPMHLLLPLVWE